MSRPIHQSSDHPNLTKTDLAAPVHDSESPDDFDEPSDPSGLDLPRTDNDERWDVFVADDDERDPLPEYGDFWEEQQPAWSMEPD